MARTPDILAKDYAWAYSHFTSEAIANYRKFREYYEGKQPLAYATEKMASKYGGIFQKFAYNRCSSVVDAIADRLQLQRFSVKAKNGEPLPEDSPERETIETFSAKMYDLNRMDARQGEQIRETLLCGDAYVIVWPRLVNGEAIPTVYMQEAHECAVRFDKEYMARTLGVKLWKDATGRWRVNLYYPDEIWRYTTADPVEDLPKKIDDYILFEPNPDDIAMGLTEAAPNPMPNPYGQVPVFHFANNARTGALGRSELVDVIPLQDALNKACTDMLVAMEYSAYRQRYATGLALGLPDPVTGKIKSPFTSGPGEVWTGPAGATFGDFEQTDLKQFLEVQNDYDKKISNISRIPMHWFQMSEGGNVSGESRKTADGPFVKKLTDRQINQGDTWEDLWALGMLQAGFEGLRLEAIWQGAELRSEKDTAETSVIKKSFGVSDEQLQRENGYDDDTIELMKDENASKLLDAQKAMSQGQGVMPSGGGNLPDSRGQTEPASLSAARAAREGRA